MRVDGTAVGGASRRNPFEAFFVDGPSGRLYCQWRPAGGAPRGPGDARHSAVLILPPFAEELNKSRRMLAQFARQSQSAGLAVLTVDLYGTGDSEGDFVSATLPRWSADLAFLVDWLGRTVGGPVSILAVRFGALLLTQLPMAFAAGGDLVLWQPVTSGRLLSSQLLRLKLAGNILAGGDQSVDTTSLRRDLRQAGHMEIAGYDVSEALLTAIEGLELRNATLSKFRSVTAFELSAEDDAQVSPALARLLAQWRAAGVNAAGRALAGAPFWSTTEIAEVPQLIAESIACLAHAGARQ